MRLFFWPQMNAAGAIDAGRTTSLWSRLNADGRGSIRYRRIDEVTQRCLLLFPFAFCLFAQRSSLLPFAFLLFR
jgi:hypothetical protein